MVLSGPGDKPTISSASSSSSWWIWGHTAAGDGGGDGEVSDDDLEAGSEGSW